MHSRVSRSGPSRWALALRRALALAGALVLLMCASSESHLGEAKLFLTACDANHPCQDPGQDCYCTCTVPCSSKAFCEQELEGVGIPSSRIVCQAPSCGAAEPGEAAVCDVTCTRDSDCLPLSESHRCEAGYCRAPLPTADDGGTAGGAGAAAIDPRCPQGGEYQDLAGGPFCILDHEVSVAEYRACVTAGECTEPSLGNYFTAGRESHPVNALGPEQATAYCTSIQAALPSREQWQFAATNGAASAYPWGDTAPGADDQPALLCAVATFSETCETAAFPAGDSASGVSDLVGNVAEYVTDGAGYCLAGGYYLDTDAANVRGDACVAFDEASLDDGGFDLTQLGFRCVLAAQ